MTELDPSSSQSIIATRWRPWARSRRKVGAVRVAVSVSLLSVALGACGGGAADVMPGVAKSGSSPDRTEGSTAVIESTQFRSRAGLEQQTEILRSLSDAVTQLRDASTSGWQVRQDDLTGGGGELSGGVITYPSGTSALDAARQFVADHGDVFGLDDPLNQLVFVKPVIDATGTATVRANQAVRGVPVEGSSLLVIVRRTLTTPEISFAKAHVFPDLARTALATVAKIDEQTAVGIAAKRGAVAVGKGTLVLTTPETTPTLAWKLDADYIPPTDAPVIPGAPVAGPLMVYVDAVLGVIVRMSAPGNLATGVAGGAGIVSQIRPGTLQLPKRGEPVEVSGTVIGGVDVTLTLEKLPDGSIVFIDSSQPNADREDGTGLNLVFDGSQVASPRDLPGDLARINEGERIDPDTFTAAWAAKTVLDYYRTEHGRSSWDGNGIPVVSTVHLPEDVVNCNAFFSGFLRQMMYGGPCRRDGELIVDSLVDISIVAHEITHGVTGTAAPYISDNSGQGAALNEGNSDYFGVIVQNLALGKPYASQGVSACMGREPNELCRSYEPGVLGNRTVDSGAIIDDGEFLLREPNRFVDAINDEGAAHDNAMIWTNALWQIRRAFASQDGGDMVTSREAARFDRIVYRAITTYFTNETDFVSAASAVEQAAIDLEASGPELDVIRTQFQLSQFCAGCATPEGTKTPVAVSPRMELKPVVLDNGIAFLGQTQSMGGSVPLQQTYFTPFDSTQPATLVGPANELVDAFDGKGTWLVEARFNTDAGWYQVTNLATGKAEKLGPWIRAADAAISADTVVWPGRKGSGYTISARANQGGATKTLTLDKLPTQLGVDGSNVVFMTEDGRVQAWNLETGDVKVLDQIDQQLRGNEFLGFPGAIKVFGGNAAVLGGRDGTGYPSFVTLYNIDSGSSDVLTRFAFPAGLSFDGDRVLWAQSERAQPSPLAALVGRTLADTELVVYSLDTKTSAIVLAQRGQQGFASLAGDRLAWQDSVSGGDDIYTAVLPEGF